MMVTLMMVAFIRDHAEAYGVEPICEVLPVAPSTYFRHEAARRDSTQRSARAQRDETLRAAIQRVWDAHYQVYGPRKVWKLGYSIGTRFREGPPRSGWVIVPYADQVGLDSMSTRAEVLRSPGLPAWRIKRKSSPLSAIGGPGPEAWILHRAE